MMMSTQRTWNCLKTRSMSNGRSASVCFDDDDDDGDDDDYDDDDDDDDMIAPCNQGPVRACVVFSFDKSCVYVFDQSGSAPSRLLP